MLVERLKPGQSLVFHTTNGPIMVSVASAKRQKLLVSAPKSVAVRRTKPVSEPLTPTAEK